jgi:hypothetical protein
MACIGTAFDVAFVIAVMLQVNNFFIQTRSSDMLLVEV